VWLLWKSLYRRRPAVFKKNAEFAAASRNAPALGGSHPQRELEERSVLAKGQTGRCSEHNELRLAGFEPATYGLGNRCSIP
jgi:hypothetical protein